MTIDISNIFLIKKSTIAFCLLVIGVLWAYLSSLMPWFMWPTVKANIVIASLFVILAFYVSFYFSTENIFDRIDNSLSSLLALAALLLMRIVNRNNIIGLTEATLTAFLIFALLKLNNGCLCRLINFICIFMGGFLSISIVGFILYLFGFPLPSSPISNEELLYSYENYYLFLIDDRAFFAIFPRFHSVFLEPGHLGTATAFLLLTQIGKWNKWYNIVLIITTCITFSLAAYVLFIMVMFASAWIQHKQVFLKVLSIIVLLIGVAIGAFFYDQGDNMLYSLIIERMEMEDGKMAGDNRVTDEFEAVYNDYVTSSDILFGREYNIDEFGFGNSGYRVFLYDYGIICLFLVLMFYLSMGLYSSNHRIFLCVMVIGTAAFWVRATPFSFYFFLPLYALPNIHTHKNISFAEQK